MTPKIYTVKSNARRDARKLGLDPATVEACEGGFVIGALREPEAAASTGPLIVRGKRARLLAMLRDGWQPMPTLARQLGWQEHTVRAAMSGLAKVGPVKIERQRVDGITQYRAERVS